MADALTLFAMGFATAWLIERIVLAFSLQRGLLVSPNARSSHTQPTPGIGGIAFVIPVVAWSIPNALAGDPVATVVALGGSALAMLGLVDDLMTLSARVRLPVHVAAVVLALWLLPWPERLTIEPLTIELEWVVAAVIAVGIVWLVNLYNFMDGIDGFAAVQCLVFCGGALLLAERADPRLIALLTVLSGSLGGFLWFNWAPARIFMGDVGSGFLGFVIGVVSLALDVTGSLPFVAAMLLLTAFWFDATYTLCARMLTRQRFAEPHRSHLYQKLAQRIGHARTTAAFAAYAIGWLLPLAWLCVREPAWQWLWVVIGAAPLLGLSIYYRPGITEERVVMEGEAR